MKFPKDFMWGGAIAAEQSEGFGITNKGKTIWDLFYSKKPEMFWSNVGPNVAIDSMKHFENDANLYEKLGMNSIRSGFSWSRLFPNDDGVPNEEAIKYYHNYINTYKKKGIKVIMTLLHFDIPLWLQKKGGLIFKNFPTFFKKYASFVFNEFNNEVDIYVTMNEPIVMPTKGYDLGTHWPLEHNPKKAVMAGYNTILAHAKAVKEFRTLDLNSKISVVINLAPPISKDGINFSEGDRKATKIFDLLYNKSMIDPMVKGIIPKELIEYLKKRDILPLVSSKDLKIIKETKIDFLGINFYAPKRIIENKTKDENKLLFRDAKYYKWEKARVNVFRGWEIRPETLYEIAIDIKQNYNNIPFWISENGIGIENEDFYKDKFGVIQDDYRISFIAEHLKNLWKGIEEGANCIGYHVWSHIDNWSWTNGFKNRYGLIEVDLKTFKRIPKKSAYWFKNVASTNYLSEKYKKLEETITFNEVDYTPSKV